MSSEALFTFIPGFLSPETASALFEKGRREIPFVEGMRCSCSTLAPDGLRRICCGNPYPRPVYNYDDADQFRKVAPGITEKIEEEISRRFTGRYECRQVWANLYRNGTDFTPEHSDSVASAVVVCLSLGGRRIFTTRILPEFEEAVPADERFREWEVNSGDLYFFNPLFNATHLHGVPPVSGVVEPRISLVFFLSTFEGAEPEVTEEDISEMMGV